VASTQQLPPGTASVLAAYGSPNQVVYMPVPMVTLPNTTAPMQMPAPPPPPSRPVHPEDQANAFSPMQGSNADSEAIASNAFSSGLTPAPVAYAQPRMPYPPMMSMPPANAMAYGYPPAMPPGQMYAGPQAPAPVLPAGYMPNPYGPMAMPRPMVPPVYPNMVAPAGYPVPMPAAPYYPPVQQTSYTVAYPQQSPAPVTQNPQQLLLTLKDALYPSHREWAASSLATVDWRANPQVVDALLLSAKEDPAATVRAGAIRALGKMNANTTTVVTTLQGLKNDIDPRVRQDVEQALANLSGK
jgi:hypothetical protein